MPGAGQLSPDEVRGLTRRSCEVIRNMGPDIQWLQSFVTDNKVYCIYMSPDEETIREHAELGGFPANSIQEVRTVIDPSATC
jgi:hypothetical protein